jgi:hypothetical protein
LAWTHVTQAQNTPNTAQLAIAPQADQLLKQMSAYIGSASEFTFHADITFDHVLPSGHKIQYMAGEEVALQRPGHVYVRWTGDLGPSGHGLCANIPQGRRCCLGGMATHSR